MGRADLGITVPYKILAVFGPNPMRGNGKDEIRYYCPKCIERKGTPDHKGKLYVNVNNLKFNCFRCGYKGQLREVKVDDNKVYEEEKTIDRSDLIEKLSSVISSPSTFNLKIPIEKVTENQTATQYLLDRGFTYEQMKYYDMRVGNINNEFGRIIIPNQVSKLVYTDFYSARTYINQVPKYHNPGKEKSKIVFNLHRIKEGSPIIVVEGALTAVAAGYHAVATLGKTMTKDQASLIIMKHPSVIFLNYDFGAEKNSEDACKLLYSMAPDIPIMEVLMPDDRDAADLSHKEYTERLANATKFDPLLRKLTSYSEK